MNLFEVVLKSLIVNRKAQILDSDKFQWYYPQLHMVERNTQRFITRKDGEKLPYTKPSIAASMKLGEEIKGGVSDPQIPQDPEPGFRTTITMREGFQSEVTGSRTENLRKNLKSENIQHIKIERIESQG